ncbi:MAG: flippase [Flavobacteriales bacterium]
MSILNKIVKQSSIYFFGSIFSVVVGFFFKIYLSKKLGAEGLGLYTLGGSIIGVIGVFLTLGHANGLVKFISKYKATKEYFKLFSFLNRTVLFNLLTASLFCFVFVFFPEFISITVLNKEELTPYVPFFGLMLFVNSFLVISDQSIRGFQEVKQSTFINTLLRLPVKIGLTILFFSIGYGLSGYILAEVVAAILACFLFFRLIKKLIDKPFIFNLNFPTIEESNFAFNSLTTNALLILQRYGDRFLLIIFLSESELGVYSVILTIAAFIPLVLISINSIFQPIISQLFSENKFKELAHYFQLSSRYIFILSFPLITFLLLFSKPILGVFGNDFINGYNLLIFVAIGELLNISFGPVGSMLQMCGMDKKLRNVSILTSIISFILFFILIKYYGLLGLGIAYIIGRGFTNICCSLLLQKELKISIFNKTYVNILVLYIVLFMIIYSIKSLFVISSLYFLFVYLLILYLLFLLIWYVFLGKKDLKELLSIFNDR